MNKRLYKRIFSLVVFVSFTMTLYAPPSGGWNPGNTEPTVPLNGELIFLIIGALVYGTKKIYSSRKKN